MMEVYGSVLRVCNIAASAAAVAATAAVVGSILEQAL